ncbi:DUF4326 domain-containing protein [Streptomyces sp. BH104]|uniref:DUF4326 domain-containing protein n=1 Tax=Streptomyces sp. BH104 TaxID=3410407 RepID=UPI003BB72872
MTPTAEPGPTTWQLTPQNYEAIDDVIDKDGIYAKGYWQEVDGKLTVVGLRIGSGRGRQVAFYGDQIIRHPGGIWVVQAAPKRIQRRRVRGWRLPGNAVIVSRPSRFGNPFTIKDAIEAEMGDPRSAAAANYAEWLRVGTAGGWYEQTYRIGRQVFDRRRVLAELHTLRGKDLACTCPLPEPGQPDHCHGATLLRLANSSAGVQS